MNARQSTGERIAGRAVVMAMLATVAAILSVQPAVAVGLVYVDADDGFDTGDPNLSPLSAINSTQSARDNLWGFRNAGAAAAPGLIGTVFESGFSSPAGEEEDEDAPELTMTLRASDGLVSGQSYDVYIVYWTANAQDWTIQAGLSSGNYTMFNRTGPATLTPVATGEPTLVDFNAGIPATSALWTSPPINQAGEPLFVEGDRTLLMGKVGTATATGGQIDLFINDLPTSDFMESLGGNSFNYRSWLDGAAFIEAGSEITLSATVNRDTGQLSLSNNTAQDVQFVSYSITSAVGGLDPNQWNSISATNPGWQIVAPETPFPSATGTLSEAEDPPAGGITLASGTAFDFGDVWIATPFEDVQISLTLADESVLTVTPQFTGDALLVGDFSGNGSIDLNDLEIFRDNLHTDVSALTPAEAYLRGDINGDLAINHADFVAFRDVFNAANGAGAFEIAFGIAVPEPASLAMLVVGLLGVLRLRTRRAPARWAGAVQPAVVPRSGSAPVRLNSGHPWHLGKHRGGIMSYLQRRFGSTYGWLMMWGMLAFASRSAHAQITYVDASSANTLQADGAPITTTGDASGTDGLWRLRAFGNEATIFESGGDISGTGSALNGNNEDVPRWVTTITGLAPDQLYSAYVFFWSPGGDQNWPIQASLTNRQGDLPVFARLATEPMIGANVSPAADPADFADPAPIVTEGDRTMFQASLGVGKANSAGELSIFIDDHPAVRQDIENGWLFRTWYDGVGFEEATVLTLRVNTITGGVSIFNGESETFDINYYEIRSDSGSLNLSGWNSFANQDGNVLAADAWQEAGGSSDNLLSEFIIDGTKSLAPSASATLGNAFNVGGAEDLAFWYGLPDGTLQSGFVEFVTVAPIPGDFNGDGIVDAADYTVWRDTDGSPGGYNTWRSNFGATSGAGGGSGLANAGAVPEPASVILVILGLPVLLLGSRRRFGALV